MRRLDFSCLVLATLRRRRAGLRAGPAGRRSEPGTARARADQRRLSAVDDQLRRQLHVHAVSGDRRPTETSYPVDAGASSTAARRVRLWKGLAVGGACLAFTVDWHRRGRRPRVPHPFFLQRHRQVTGEADGMRREETAVHIQAQYQLPPFGRLHVRPGRRAEHHRRQADDRRSTSTTRRSSPTIPRRSPASIRSASTGTATGFNAGVDLQWMFTRTSASAALVRFTQATVDLDVDNRTIQVDAGGRSRRGIRLAF